MHLLKKSLSSQFRCDIETVAFSYKSYFYFLIEYIGFWPSRHRSVGRAFTYGAKVSSSSPTNACCRYVEEIDSVAMLATKRPAGVTPEVNLREHVILCFHQVQIRLLTLALKPRADITRSPKQGYQWPHKKTYVLQNTFVVESCHVSNKFH